MTTSVAGLLLLPGLVMMLGGAVLMAFRGPARAAAVVVVPAAVLALIWVLPEGTAAPVRWLGYDLVPFRSDALARLFGSAFAIAALAGGLFGLGQTRRLETPFAYLYAGGAIGVAFAGDLVTLFVFWEAMAFLAAVVVWLGGPGARGAGQRYIVVHVLGGVLLMAGTAGQVAATGSVAFVAMAADSPATWLILLGFLVNVAAWPLAAWLPDAYPAATWSGTVFLSAFTTKAAVLALIRGFPGAEVLVPVGIGMIVYGTLYAACASDIRKLLSYALVAQLGFMVTATGVGSEVALNGAAAHAVASIVYQALLFMVAGSVIVMTGKSDCASLGGLWRAMPVTAAAAVVGALAIAAFPLTSGDVA
jgi:multicomponent Na+:H+ antiporter subunit D